MESLKILWINWRDIKNPEAGGAEIYTHEVTKRLVEAGHEVVLLSSTFHGGKKEEEIDGVRVARVGNKYMIYFKAHQYYESNNNYDIIIEGINTVPFLSPMYAKSKPKIIIVYQINRELQFSLFPFPISVFMFFGEHLFWKYYASSRNSIYVTISKSAKEELERLIDERSVVVAEPGLDYEYFSAGDRQARSCFPFILYLNRVVPYKNPKHLIQAFCEVKKIVPEAKLYIGGCRRTKYEQHLKNLTHTIKIHEAVVFYDYLSNPMKREYMQKAWVHVLPSTKEGWGISVMEAASCGTPTIAYDVSGLRDSVKNGETGVLVPFGNIKALTEAIIKIIEDNELRSVMSAKAREWATNFSWSKTTNTIQAAIESALAIN